MTKVLSINASARYEDSISRQLTDKLTKKIIQNEHSLVHRDLNGKLHFVSEESLKAVQTPLDERTAEQDANAALADELIEELKNADVVVIGSPIYNFGPPASLKAWADLVARAGTTFKYTENGPEGLLKGKKAYIVAVSGGTQVNSEIDFMTPWLKFFLGFIGIGDVEIIKADGIFGKDGEEKIQIAKQKIESITL